MNVISRNYLKLKLNFMKEEKLIPIRAFCERYQCTRQWIHKLEKEHSILDRIGGRVFVNESRFLSLAISNHKVDEAA